MTISSYLHLSKWQLRTEAGSFAESSRWSNEDMDPVPYHLRTWTTWNYVAYWISDAANVAAWELASSMLSVGLSWRQALPAIAIGHTLIALVMVANGTIGARLHVPFPVLVRSSFGFWFSYFAVVSRIVLSMFWFGIQSWTGSECVYQMLKAIWPSTARIPNRLDASAHVTTVDMMSYFIFWLIQFPFMFLSPQQIRWLFVAKALIVPPTWIAIFIWAVVKAPVAESLNQAHSSLSGSQFTWSWIGSMNSALGVWLTLAVNIPDFTRYAKRESSQYIQLAIIPPIFTLIGFVGLVVTSTGTALYGETLWDPLTLINRWDNRAAAFFASASFALATIGTNVSANSLSAANDMTALFPKYINIRRGQVLCAILGGWALAPWEVLASGEKFLSFMSGYTVFLGPFAAILVSDYYFVHRGNVDVPSMYRLHGRYRYWNGVNWRVVVALVVSVTPGIPGLITSIEPKIDTGNWLRLFQMDSIYGFWSAALVYWLLSVVFPARETFMDAPVMTDERRSSEESSVEEVQEKA
ncbi:hypothetical protein VKT23_017301 [Stygiomarasmius scandens]|uniref:Cytosine-purine permease n=1 Tax=Marasmiellus scandens TaxID=2682957 RepID=A0ABR1ISN0_9AGAR